MEGRAGACGDGVDGDAFIKIGKDVGDPSLAGVLEVGHGGIGKAGLRGKDNGAILAPGCQRQGRMGGGQHLLGGPGTVDFGGVIHRGLIGSVQVDDVRDVGAVDVDVGGGVEADIGVDDFTDPSVALEDGIAKLVVVFGVVDDMGGVAAVDGQGVVEAGA